MSVVHRLKLLLVSGVGVLTFTATRVALASTRDLEDTNLVADAVTPTPSSKVLPQEVRAQKSAVAATTVAQNGPLSISTGSSATTSLDMASEVTITATPELPPISHVDAAPVALRTNHARLHPLTANPIAGAIGGVAVGAPMADWRAIISHPGVSLSFSEISDASGGTGAMSAARALRTHSMASIAMDFDSIAGVRGLSGFAQYKSKTGRNGSGAASFSQNFSNIDADDFSAFGEAWLEQRLFSDRVRIKAGRLDFNTEFAGTDNGASFLNASMGFSPSITAAPTFPLPSNGANLVVSPRGSTSVSFGVFDGLDGAPAQVGHASLFHIGQLRQEWSLGGAQLAGKLGVGAWRHNGIFLAADAAADAEPAVAGTHGWYATLDQTLWQGAAGADEVRPTIAGFAQLGRSDPHVQSIQSHDGGGLTFAGLLPHRTGDVLGLGVTRARWLDGHELIHESFYQLPLSTHFSLVADLQHVSRRTADLGMHRGTVTTLRTIVSF